MRITPIESPRNPFVRLMYRLMRRQFGRTITPWKVLFARLPHTIPAQLGIYWGIDKGLGLDPELTLLIETHVSSLNGCSFCLDIGRAMATYRGHTLEKVDALPSYRTSPLFDDRERAVLAFVEQATRTRHVDDATFAALRRQADEREIVAITWLAAVENFFNVITGALAIGSDGLCAIAEERTGRRAPGGAPAPAAAGH